MYRTEESSLSLAHRRSTHWCALLCAICALIAYSMSLPASSSAYPANAGDDPTAVVPDPGDPPVTLVPEGGGTSATGKGGKGGGGATTNVVSPRRYTISVANGWSSMRNAPNSWFIGTAGNGMTLNAFNPPAGSTYRMGYLTERNMCGWISENNLTNNNTTGSSACDANWSLNVADFSTVINCDTCNGGWTTHLTGNTCYLRNIYPWYPGPYDTPPTMPVDFTVCNPAGKTVQWRYISKNGLWVAISDSDYQQAWFFVPRVALPSNICAAGTHPSSVWPGANVCNT
jgi:hypothetical protein